MTLSALSPEVLAVVKAAGFLSPSDVEVAVVKAKADGWDEGNAHGYQDRQGYELGDGCGNDYWDCTCPNPYRLKEGITH